MKLSRGQLRKLIVEEAKRLNEDERPRVDDVMLLVEDDPDVYEAVEALTNAVGGLIARVAKNEVGDEGWSDQLESPDMYADVDNLVRRAVYEAVKEGLAKFDIEVR